MFGLSLIPSVLSSSSVVTAGSEGSRSPGYANTHAIDLDGTGDLIKTFKSSDLQTFVRSDFSVSFWVKASSWQTFYLMGLDTTTGANTTAVFMRSLNIGAVYWQTSIKLGGVAFSGLAAAGTPSTSDYVHFVVTLRKGGASTNGTFKLYVDGVEKISTDAATGTEQDSTLVSTPFVMPFGAYQSSGGSFSGHATATFDEIAMWTTALGASEVTALYNSGSTFDISSDNGDYTSSAYLENWYRLNNDLTNSGTSTVVAQTEGDPAFVTTPTPP